jgi:uncharacterized membrane protein
MPRWIRVCVFTLLTLACLGVGGYTWYGYTVRPLGSLVHPDMQAVYESQRVGIYAHVFGASLALLLGPWQFLPGLRQRRPALHRLIGRIYLGIAVLVGGLAGLYMSFFAFGGIISTLGFASLAVVWLATGALALRAILRGDVTSHRRWMIRNFSLACAAITLRVGLGLCFAAGLAFEDFYVWLAWVSWIPNALFAEFIIRRRAGS